MTKFSQYVINCVIYIGNDIVFFHQAIISPCKNILLNLIIHSLATNTCNYANVTL